MVERRFAIHPEYQFASFIVEQVGHRGRYRIELASSAGGFASAYGCTRCMGDVVRTNHAIFLTLLMRRILHTMHSKHAGFLQTGRAALAIDVGNSAVEAVWRQHSGPLRPRRPSAARQEAAQQPKDILGHRAGHENQARDGVISPGTWRVENARWNDTIVGAEVRG